MKLNYLHKLSQYPLLFLLVLVLFSSCTVYQNVPDTDGIYSPEKNRTKIIVDGSKEYQENENKYFTKELERIDLINDTDILTNIETYSSIEDTTNNATESTNPYNVNSVWGNSDSEQIVINLNLNNVGYGFNNYWNFYDPYNTYGYLNPWNRRAWRFGWRGRFGDPSFLPGYGYFQLPYFNPFFNGIYGYGYFNSRKGYSFDYSSEIDNALLDDPQVLSNRILDNLYRFEFDEKLESVTSNLLPYLKGNYRGSRNFLFTSMNCIFYN